MKKLSRKLLYIEYFQVFEEVSSVIEYNLVTYWKLNTTHLTVEKKHLFCNEKG